MELNIKRVIWKFPIKLRPDQEIWMPQDSKIISVGVQDNENVSVWAEVNPQIGKSVVRRIVIRATGHLYEPGPEKFIGTVLTWNGVNVWHVYEAPIPPAPVSGN